MFPYIPLTKEEEHSMLKELGINSVDELFNDIDKELKPVEDLKLDKAKSEIEVRKIMQNLQSKNTTVNNAACFLGAGAYDHYIPAIIPQMVNRTEFLTSYTPYQPEISQGTLQYIFEFQSLLCELTGMPIVNASLYDGGSSVAEAAIMASSVARKKKVLVSKTINPSSLSVLKTYSKAQGLEIVELDCTDSGLTDLDELEKQLNDEYSSVIIQSPNFFGNIEDIEKAVSITRKFKKVSFIMSADPNSFGLLKDAGSLDVDILVGEAQTLGIPLSFGGPYLGFIAIKDKYLRKIPGRIVGETVDLDNKRSFVLTLTAREQHIRREKATSNICSNQGVNTLVAAMYMSLMGKKGIKEVALQSHKKASYLKEELLKTGKFTDTFKVPFYKEFVLSTELDIKKLNDELLKNNIIGPYDLQKANKDYKGLVMFAVTEKRTKEEMDKLVEIVRGL